MSWSSFVEAAPAGGHAVQVYDDPEQLAASVARFFDAGLAGGVPAVAIVTPEHLQLIVRGLEACGRDVAALERQGLLTVRDAEETLASLMEGELPSADRFVRVVGGLLDEVESRFPETTVRAFGEMVDVLWRRGEERAALALEELWNELAATRSFALLCGYRLDIFDVDVEARALPEVLRVHSHALPAADPARLAAAVDKALVEVAGPMQAARIYLELAEKVPRSTSSRAQALLMWLSAENGPLAKRILERVRSRYLGAGAAPAPAR
jgi:hypothetical protein